MTKLSLLPRATRINGHALVTSGLTQDSAVVDLGFNEGAFANEVVRRFGCRVYAAEPLPALRAAATTLPGVELDGVAISGSGGSVVLHDNPSRCATVETALAEEGATQVRVRAVTLERFLARVPQDVAVLKLDIEGAELEVLSNAPRQTLARVRQITVEFHDFLDAALEPHVRLVYARLSELGFSRVRFARGNDDVLFIRSDLLPIPWLARAWLAARYKYPWGIGRMVKRRVIRRSRRDERVAGPGR